MLHKGHNTAKHFPWNVLRPLCLRWHVPAGHPNAVSAGATDLESPAVRRHHPQPNGPWPAEA